MSWSDVEVAIAAARAGAEVIVRDYGADHARFAKSGTDFATQTDVEAEAAIVGALTVHRPGTDSLVRNPGTAVPRKANDAGSSTPCAAP